MSLHRNLLIVLADGEHVRFVRPVAHNALHSVDAIDSEAARKQSSDLGTDRPGSTAHHGLAPRHDLHDMEKAKFARFVGDQINAGATDDAFDALIVVAPAHTLNEILGELNTVTKKMVTGTLAKDLVKVPDAELQPHLAEWVAPVRREDLLA
jgi:protein required for attachment to host cells